jgi:hypothetical protein
MTPDTKYASSAAPSDRVVDVSTLEQRTDDVRAVRGDLSETRIGSAIPYEA